MRSRVTCLLLLLGACGGPHRSDTAEPGVRATAASAPRREATPYDRMLQARLGHPQPWLPLQMPDGRSMSYVSHGPSGTLILIPSTGTGYRIVEASVECGGKGVAFGRQYAAADDRAQPRPSESRAGPFPDPHAVLAACAAKGPRPLAARGVVAALRRTAAGGRTAP